MHRVLSLLAGGLLVPVPLALPAQSWVKQSPFPTPWDLNGVAFFPDGMGFICGIDRTLYKSLDGGATWQFVNIGGPNGEPFHTVRITSGFRVFILGNSSDAWRSLDGGTSWNQMASMPAGSWRHIDFVATDIAFAGANGALAKTIDGGLSWVARSGYPTCPVIYGMDFWDENLGLAGGSIAISSTPGIFRTVDGGLNWARTYNFSANDVVFLNANTAIATIGQDIVRTNDGGMTWSVIASGITSGLLDLENVGNGLVLGVSGKGDIWRSADNGVTWTKVLRGIGALPASWAIHASTSTEAWAVGASGFILKSSDAGLTWRQMNNGMGEQIYEIEFADLELGFAAAHNGYIFRTRDGGQRWDVVKVEVTGQIFGRDETLHSVSVYDQMNVVVGGPGGTVFRTNDGGDTWQSIGYPNLPSSFWIEKVLMVDPQTIWAVGLDQDLGHNRAVYKTTDGGQTWSLALSRNSYFFDIDFLDAQRGVLHTTGPLYFTTADGGQTWTARSLPEYFTSPSPSDADFADANTGWVVGWYGMIGKTTNGGLTFSYQSVGRDDVNFFGVSAVSTTEVWICGRTAGFLPVTYRTTNGGQTWQLVPGGDPQNWFYTIHARNEGNVWAAGYGGMVYRRATTMIALPNSVTTIHGVHTAGGVFETRYSDDLWYVVTQRPAIATGLPSASIELGATSPDSSPSSIKLHVETGTSAIPANSVPVRVKLYNFQSAVWELVDSRQATSTDNAITINIVGSPARFVHPTSREMKARIEWYDPFTLLTLGWMVRVDRFVWEVGLP